MNVPEYLRELCDDLKSQFEENKRVMSFQEYLELVRARPRQQSRNAAQYLLDCFEHYGEEESIGPLGTRRRWRLFDTPFDDGRDRLIGQERVQDSIYRIVQNFARQGRINKLLLLHGPNGSSKSSLLGCIVRALEAYSHTDDGALYCFNWIFPGSKAAPRRLGFGSGGPEEDTRETFAYLEDDKIDALIAGDLRDHPLLLLPMEARRALLTELLDAQGIEGFQLPDALAFGELAPRNQRIAERLFAGYHGDMAKLLRHIQVERFFISRRYRRGAVTVEPQIHVDAAVRQLTGDRSLTSLPLVLQSTTLYEAVGDLVDANRGLIEYNDLLKRPLDTFKYLLSTSEKGSVALPNQILHLDLVLMSSSNENHLNAFKEYPDWPSFKARIELVRVPYLRCYRTEQSIYDEQVRAESLPKRIAPHATFVAALWAVLTRLRKPQPDRFPKDLRGVIAALTPLQKADLYATGRTPSGLNIEKARLLRAHLRELFEERSEDSDYEGQIGASPREMKIALLNAAQRPDFTTLSPLAVLAEIGALCKQTSVYSFLRVEPEGQFLDPPGFIQVVRERWLDLADEELTVAMGLVTRDQYDELFRRYLVHVSHYERGEKMRNPITGDFEEADTRMMEEMEKHFEVEKDRREFRRELLGRIGAASQKDTVKPTDYRALFPDLFESLESSYYAEQRPTVRKLATDALSILDGNGNRVATSARHRAQETLDVLYERFGYDEASAKETIVTLLTDRYTE